LRRPDSAHGAAEQLPSEKLDAARTKGGLWPEVALCAQSRRSVSSRAAVHTRGSGRSRRYRHAAPI